MPRWLEERIITADEVPAAMVSAQATLTHTGMAWTSVQDPYAIRARVITPMVFCASFVPWASETSEAEPTWPQRKPASRRASGTEVTILKTIQVPRPATTPVIAGVVAGLGTWIVFKIVTSVPEARRDAGFRWGPVGSASLVSLAHGTNDAQKTMGVITLALIAYGSWTNLHAIPVWVKIACAVTIAAGTWVGGWRVIRTLGKGLVEITSPQGMAAETASAAIILSSSHLGMALSTTHVATGSILGSGVGKPGAQVRWAVAGRMAIAWLITMPAAGLVGAACWYLAHVLGG